VKTVLACIQALTKRDERLTAVASKVERGMTVVGATAIEDKLQDVSHLYRVISASGHNSASRL
jgi:magnesium-transporting ATPase (P-type)